MTVSDSGRLIALARIGRLDLLPALYGGITIPPAVQREVIEGKAGPGARLLASAPWLQVVAVRNPLELERLEQRLDGGESQAIAMALELSANLLLLDEARGRRAAEARQLRVTGTLGTLVLAKTQGMIVRLQPLLDDLIAAEFRMGAELYLAVLALAGEAGEFDARAKG